MSFQIGDEVILCLAPGKKDFYYGGAEDALGLPAVIEDIDELNSDVIVRFIDSPKNMCKYVVTYQEMVKVQDLGNAYFTSFLRRKTYDTSI